MYIYSSQSESVIWECHVTLPHSTTAARSAILYCIGVSVPGGGFGLASKRVVAGQHGARARAREVAIPRNPSLATTHRNRSLATARNRSLATAKPIATRHLHLAQNVPSVKGPQLPDLDAFHRNASRVCFTGSNKLQGARARAQDGGSISSNAYLNPSQVLKRRGTSSRGI